MDTDRLHPGEGALTACPRCLWRSISATCPHDGTVIPRPGDRLVLDWDPGVEAAHEVTVIAVGDRGDYLPGEFDVLRDGDTPAQATTVMRVDLDRGVTWRRA